VLPNGDVDIKWNKPDDPFNTFIAYEVYTANNYSGPYNRLDSITDVDSNFFTHNGANAQNAQKYYLLKTVSGCGNTAKPQDTAVTMLMSVTNPLAGYANLNWNPTHNPLLPTSTGIYDVYREYPPGVWTYIGSTNSTSYVDTITVCNDTISYKVHIGDTLAFDTSGAPIICESVSSVDKDLFADISAPDEPIIDTVSIDPLTGKTYIGWDENAWDDTRGYIIYLVVAGQNTPIDTIYGKTSTNFIDSINNSCGSSYNTYRIAAIDSCNNTSPLSAPHNNLFLETIKDVCDDNITVVWNKYINMESGIDRYELYVSENSAPYTLLSTLTPADTFYEHINLIKDAQYCYILRVYDNSGSRSATSCMVCDIANKPNLPQFSYVQSASVLPGNNGVEIRFYTDTTAFVSEYKVERGDGPGGPWNLMGTVNPAPQPTLNYTDYLAAVNTKDYYYRITVVDSCGDDAVSSLPARTMFLQSEVLDSFKVKLDWNEYSGFSGAPTQYKVFRKVDGVLDPNPIAILPATQSDYTDNLVSMMNTSQGTFHYYVYAYEGPGNMYNLPSDSARSNEVKAVLEPKVFVPTAFDPNSNITDNNTFYPRGQFITSKQYLFQVYNRWGELIFESEKLNDGWDGTYKGQQAQMGVYTYFLRFETSSGELFEKRGTVTLLK
jgi:gliding motility-associated-like protein